MAQQMTRLEARIRSALTDEVLDGFFRTAAGVQGSDKFFPSIQETTEYFNVFREGLAKAVTAESPE